jgi:hypothetical protein
LKFLYNKILNLKAESLEYVNLGQRPK